MRLAAGEPLCSLDPIAVIRGGREKRGKKGLKIGRGGRGREEHGLEWGSGTPELIGENFRQNPAFCWCVLVISCAPVQALNAEDNNKTNVTSCYGLLGRGERYNLDPTSTVRGQQPPPTS